MKRILLLTAVAIMSLALPITANAQAKTKKTKTSSKADTPPTPITTQTATTEDGRKALLKSDGTWQYGNNDVVITTAPTKENSTLKIETGIVLRSGDVKPVPRKSFYLLDKSFASIMLNEGHVKFIGDESKITTAQSVYGVFLLNLGESVKAGGYGRYQNNINSVMSAIKPHVIQIVTTDFSGKATLNKLQAGTYWLLGFTTINADCIIWDIETNLSAGDNSLILDQHNSGYVWDRCL